MLGSVTAKKLAPGEGELLMFGTIGEDFWGDGITATGFNDALNALGDVSAIRLRINSGGGDVFEATAIYNMLVKQSARVIVEVEGVAASAATLIAMAGDEIHISENAHWMIHAASGIAWGNAAQLRDYLKLLDNADDLIRLTYSRRTGQSMDNLASMMSKDNWMTAAEAKELGFVDHIDEAKSVEPHVKPDEPEDVIEHRPAAMTAERLAAMTANLRNLALLINMPEGMDPNMPMVGDRVKIVGEPHMDGHDEGVVRQVIHGALGIEFDDMPGEVHHWYVASEVMVLESSEAMPIEPDEPMQRARARIAASAVKHVLSSSKGSDMKLSAKLRAKCIAAGMAENLNDDDAAKWYDQHEDKVLAGLRLQPGMLLEIDTGIKPPDPPLTMDGVLDAIEARDRKKIEARKAWKKEVDANLLLAFPDGPAAELKDTCYDLQDTGIDAVRAKIQEARKEVSEQVSLGGPRINLSASQPRDRHVAAIRTGVLVRALSSFAAPTLRRPVQDDNGRWVMAERSINDVVEQHAPMKDRPKGWEDFSQMPLLKIAEETLIADGVNYESLRRLSSMQVACAAMGFGSHIGLPRAAAIHTTGTLAEITRDAINKSLLAGYAEAPQTWRGPMRQASSVNDLKDIHRIRLSGAANLPVWQDNLPPEEAKLSNEKEKYAVEPRALKLSFSWRLVLNDDMDALSRRPQIMGNSAARTINTLAWAQITGNPAMTDGQTLFLETPTGNRKRKNLTTGSATPTNTTIGAMRALMRLMHGLNTPEGEESPDILNLAPTYIAGPAALEEVILKQVNSTADPAASGNAGVYNTSRNLMPIIEPLLDANSTTAWYLFASPAQVDTVEVSFLAGQETPYVHEWMDDETMCQYFSIIQTSAAKAIDHRGIQKHAGA